MLITVERASNTRCPTEAESFHFMAIKSTEKNLLSLHERVNLIKK